MKNVDRRELLQLVERRAVTCDLASAFNFAAPDDFDLLEASANRHLPLGGEWVGDESAACIPTLNDGFDISVPTPEKGVRCSRSPPCALYVTSELNTSKEALLLTFLNSGASAAVFQVRSGNTAEAVRHYTVAPGKKLTGAWHASPSYGVSVHGPNGFARYFKGCVGPSAAVLETHSIEGTQDVGSIGWVIANDGATTATVTVRDLYTGKQITRRLEAEETFDETWSLHQSRGCYDLLITVAEDKALQYRLAGHVATGRDRFADPAHGGFALQV